MNSSVFYFLLFICVGIYLCGFFCLLGVLAGGMALALFSKREVWSVCRSKGKSSVCRRDVQECFVAWGHSFVCALQDVCLSLLCLCRRGAEMGEWGIEVMAEAPLCVGCLFPVPVPSLLHTVLWGWCLLKGRRLLHHNSSWFLISAADLQELLWSEVSSGDYYPRCALGQPCSGREVGPADPLWSWSLPAWPLPWFCDMWTHFWLKITC